VPEVIVPELAPEGEIDHVTFWFAAPATVAESCQFAPMPIEQGYVVEEAQLEFAMLTVTCCCVAELYDEPPQPVSAKRDKQIIARARNRRLESSKAHRRVKDLHEH
jgi:hypothetical protein